MNAVEKLEAAIAKLTAQRGAATFGAWVAWKQRTARFSMMVYGVDTDDGDDVCSMCEEADAELIATLHRTIDPQLAILRIGVQFAQITPNRYTDAAVDLAAAILGVSDADVG